MRQRVIETFRAVYGHAPAFLVRAPGRANLIGEHTDYNQGYVMPLAIDQALWLAASPRPDQVLRIHSLDFGGRTVSFPVDRLEDERLPHWSRHVRGAWWLFSQKGYDPPGADIALGSRIPIGAGLSSSAAIGVAVVEAVLALLGETGTDQIEKALLAVEIEHRFLHMPCGVMDQIASAAGIEGAAMLLDCRSLETAPVPIPPGVRVVVMNTMKSRTLADSAYAQRRRECEEAAARLGIAALRDATLEMLAQQRDLLGSVRYRRARHVVTENARTLAMREALRAGRLDQAGWLLNASHASLRYDYQVSTRELDLMSELARSHPACYGARMMGGGFGGSAVALVRADGVGPFAAAVGAGYQAQLGIRPEIIVCAPSAGSSVEERPSDGVALPPAC
jgi:galactokinase